MLKTRKDFELAIIHNMENKPVLENILIQAIDQHIFTPEEVRVIIKESKLYDQAHEEKHFKIIQYLKGTKGLVLSYLIKLYPMVDEDAEGWFLVDVNQISKALDRKFVIITNILNSLSAEGYISKKIKKGVRGKLNLEAIACILSQ